MTRRYFDTRYGHRIDFVDGYRAAHAPKRDVDPGKISEVLIADRIKDHPSDHYEQQMPFKAFVKDVAEYCLVMEFLESLGVAGPWERALDMGGAEGTISRLLRADGRVRHSVCNDLIDLRHRLSDRHFRGLFRKFRVRRGLGRLFQRRFALPDYAVDFGPEFRRNRMFGNIVLRQPPRLDEYLAGDFYEISNRFDFISSLLSLEYFEPDKVLSKISGLLDEGGIFVFLVNNFWWPINSTQVVGDFPYAAQRLDRCDLEKYLRAVYPNEADDAMYRYDYFARRDEKPTLDDYIEAASRHDLVLLGAQRLIPADRKHRKTAFPPFVLDQFEATKIPDVLRDIQAFRPDVRLIDLRTAYHMAAFVKRTRVQLTPKNSPVMGGE